MSNDDESTTLARRAPPVMLAPQTMDDLGRLASMLAKAQGFVPKHFVGNPNAIGAAIVTGMELGLGPMESLREVYVVDGKPTLSANLMLSLAIKAGVKPQWLEQSDAVARLRLTREGFEPHVQAYTIDDAKRAGLAGKGVWQKHPASMLRARCISSAMRAYCPDVLGGSVYVHGEIDDADREPSPADYINADAVDVSDSVQDGEPEEVPRDLSPEVQLAAEALLDAATEEDLEDARKMSRPIWPHLNEGQRERLTKCAAEAKVRIAEARRTAEEAAMDAVAEAAEQSDEAAQ